MVLPLNDWSDNMICLDSLETVLKGLNACSCHNCNKCPYYIGKYNDGTTICFKTAMLRSAECLLKEQKRRIDELEELVRMMDHK